MARRAYLDWARGLAVLIMIQAHTLDAWTADFERSTIAFRNLIILGGFAAPLFLFLAGVGLALSGERTRQQHGWKSAGEAAVTRGLQIFVLAFLFRLQAFIASPGNPLISLFRVDILNVMGLSMVAGGLVWFVARTPLQAAFMCGAAAFTSSMVTPLVRNAAWVNALPVWVQWYARPAGEHTTFTLLPWAGFTFAGAAWGIAASRSTTARSERRLHVWTVALGAALILLGFYTASQRPLFRTATFWTSSPTYFAIRVGILLSAVAVLYFAATVAAEHRMVLRPLERLGRGSFFIYWIHVELVYGYASWPIWHRLELWQTTAAYVAFCGLMYGALGVRDRVVNRWRAAPAYPVV